MKKIDLLAIGDITTDAFIHLQQAHIADAVNHTDKEICFPFGGKVPFESVKIVRAVGNAGNVAVCASRLGLSNAIVTDIGKDQNGKINKVISGIVPLKINTNLGNFVWAY